MHNHTSSHHAVCIHQPDFAPWLGFFERLAHSDTYIVLDHVQYVRRGWHNRDRFEIGGTEKWLTVPVISKGQFNQTISETIINNTTNWRHHHLETFKIHYSKAAYFDDYFPQLYNIYKRDHQFLIDLNMAIIEWALQIMELDVNILYSSSLSPQGSRDKMLVSLCNKINTTHYHTGTGAKSYLSEELFDNNGIKVVWQNWELPKYERGTQNYIPGLSFVDALFHIGPSIKDLIR